MKKKNLLKCLALTSMLALSVGAVTSCGTQGEAGKDGAQGAQGATGAKGEQGDKGEDGKTYLEVIVVPGGIESGLTIEQDKYYVQAGETFTLTFKNAKGETPEVIFDFEINGVEISLEPGTASYTYTATAEDTGFQINSAKFGDVEDYAEVQIYAEVLKLWGTDKQLYLDQTKVEASYKNADDFSASDYYTGSKSVWDEAGTQLTAAKKAIADLDEPTLAEKVTAAKTAISTAVTKIDEAYAAAVKSAKEEAIKAYDKLDDNLDAYTGYVTADREAINTESKAAINACTTLEGLAQLVNEQELVKDGGSIGKYTHMLTAKKACYDAIDLALSDKNIPDDEPFAEGEETELATLKEQLAIYGVSIDKLPSEVAKTWEAKVSSEKDFPVYSEDSASGAAVSYSKGDIVMEVEAYNAVVESYSDLKDDLKAGIIASYNAEINASKVLGSDGMTTMRGIVNSAVNTWISIMDSDNSATLSYYMSAKWNASHAENEVPLVTNTDDGLVGYIESQLAYACKTTAYSGFGVERKANAGDAFAKSVGAYYSAALSDSEYKALLGTDYTSGTNAGKTKTLIQGGKTGAKVNNPLFTETVAGTSDIKAETGDTSGYGYILTTAKKTAASNIIDAKSGTLVVDAYKGYDVKDYYKSVVKKNSSGVYADCALATTLADNTKTVLDIKQAAESFEDDFETIREAALALYKSAQEDSIYKTGTPATGAYAAVEGDYIKGSSILANVFVKSLPSKVDGTYDAKNTMFGDVSTAAYNLITVKANLVAFDSGLTTWAHNHGNDFDGFVNLGVLQSGSEVYKQAMDATDSSSILSKVLAGTYSNASQIAKAIEELSDTYESSVKAYGEKSKDNLLKALNIKIDGLTESVAAPIKEAYNDALKLFGYVAKPTKITDNMYTATAVNKNVFACDTFASIDTWFTQADAYMDAVKTNAASVTTFATSHGAFVLDLIDNKLAVVDVDFLSTDVTAAKTNIAVKSTIAAKMKIDDAALADAASSSITIDTTNGNKVILSSNPWGVKWSVDSTSTAATTTFKLSGNVLTIDKAAVATKTIIVKGTLDGYTDVSYTFTLA